MKQQELEPEGVLLAPGEGVAVNSKTCLHSSRGWEPKASTDLGSGEDLGDICSEDDR